MPSLGSWIRFIVGILLSAEVVRQWLFGTSFSMFANIMAIVFLVLSAIYFIARF